MAEKTGIEIEDMDDREDERLRSDYYDEDGRESE